MPEAVIATRAANCVAVVSALLSLSHTRRLQRRPAQLARLNA